MRSVWIWIALWVSGYQWVSAQKIAFIWDPDRSAYTVAATTDAGRLYNRINDAKETIVLDKAYFVRDLLVMNALEQWLDMKQREAVTSKDLEQVMQLYSQTKQMVEDMWTDYDRIFIQTKDSVRMRTENAFEVFKKVSDYKVGQIHRRYEKFVNDGSFMANKRERMTLLQECYDEMRKERAKVARMASVLYAMASNPNVNAKGERKQSQKQSKGFDLW